ncbi:hypothetical protein JTB14_025287 [Gonioctena quinquepunctata]|nr:hypothetical protein JTB14_025287 [Gonioctena quinquepunctata]
MNNQDIPRCSKVSDIKTRKRKLEPLKQRELENFANNLDEISDLKDPYSSDYSVYNKKRMIPKMTVRLTRAKTVLIVIVSWMKMRLRKKHRSYNRAVEMMTKSCFKHNSRSA